MPQDVIGVSLLVEIAIEPRSRDGHEKLRIALARLTAEDPSFRVSTDRDSGQTLLKGTSEDHLEVKIDMLQRIFGIDANIGAPQVAFRERITKRVENSYTHKKQTGDTGQFAAVTLIVEPNEPGMGNEFESKIVGGAVPRGYIPGVEKGIESVLTSGVVAGFPIMDVKVQLIDGKYHDVDFLGAGVRNRHARLFPRGFAERQVRAARADHEGRGGDPGKLHRLGHRRPQLAARPNPGPGHARRYDHRQRKGAAHDDVRLHQHVTRDVGGARLVCNAIRSLCPDAALAGG